MSLRARGYVCANFVWNSSTHTFASCRKCGSSEFQIGHHRLSRADPLATISDLGGRREGISDNDRDDYSELTFNHVRRLPHRVEHRELRIVYWSTLITLLRMAHVGRFPNRSFGKDLQLIVVYGAVILALLEGRKPTIASIARYLQLPHETTRRYLKTVVDLGLLTQNGREYKPTELSRKGIANADKIERLLIRAASELYL